MTESVGDRVVADRLMTPQDRQEALSRVYARAVAAQAGYVTADYDFDRDGVDLRIQAGGAMRPALELQLKATGNPAFTDNGGLRFPLKSRNYNLLRIDTQTPRLLVVLYMPKDQCKWVVVTRKKIALRGCLEMAVRSRNLILGAGNILLVRAWKPRKARSLFRHSRESGNPELSFLTRCAKCSTWTFWIPAFAGMTRRR